MAFVVALDKDEALVRIDAAGQQQRECLQRLLAALGRIDMDGQRVQVGDEVVALVFFLHLAPVADSAEVVAEREFARRLDA